LSERLRVGLVAELKKIYVDGVQKFACGGVSVMSNLLADMRLNVTIRLADVALDEVQLVPKSELLEINANGVGLTRGMKVLHADLFGRGASRNCEGMQADWIDKKLDEKGVPDRRRDATSIVKLIDQTHKILNS
jgi:hypothetical protein